jgi:hypothetical protein
MAKSARRLPHPIFHEPILPDPVFSEDQALPSPTGFETTHTSDTATYDAVAKLLKKQVVAVPKSRAADDALYSLETAYGSSHRPLVIQKIKAAKKIIFHALGDSGASDVRKYHNELRVSDQVTIDCAVRPSQPPCIPVSSWRRRLQLRGIAILLRSVLRRVSKLPGAHLGHTR